MIDTVTFEKTTYNVLPHKFEAGTPHVAGGLGLSEAIDYVCRLGFDSIQAHEHALLESATEKLQSLPGLRIIGTSTPKSAVISFVIDGAHPHDLGTLVDQDGIAIRTGASLHTTAHGPLQCSGNSQGLIFNLQHSRRCRGFGGLFDQSSKHVGVTMSDSFSDIRLMVQPTPNPHAFKYVLSREVKAKGKVTYNNKEECHNNPLAQALFDVPSVTQLYFFENMITVTFSPDVNYLEADGLVQKTLKEKIVSHDPEFSVEGDEDERRAQLPPELREIEEILDRTIRPGLQGDGGDLEVISYIDGELSIRYQGACGSCPSSTMGTLMAIEGILREEFDPDITVIPV